MNTVDFQLPNYGAAGSQLVTDYFNKTFIPNLQVRAQSSVSFGIKAFENLSAGRVAHYFNTLIEALSIYYFYAHTYAYCQVPENKNTAMFALRELFATSDLQNLRLLEERLNGLPVPNRLNELCYWMFDVYRASSVAGSDLIRFSPMGFDNPDDTKITVTRIQDGANLIENILDKLADQGNYANYHNLQTSDLLSRVCPNWVNTRVGSSIGIPVHDPTFTTLFFNAPLVGGPITSDPLGWPEYEDFDTDTPYNVYCEELDGLIESMFTWTTSTGTPVGWMDAIPCSVGTKWTNRFTYADGTEGDAFYGYNRTATLWSIRPDTYKFYGNDSVGIGTTNPFAVPALGVSPGSVTEASVNAIGYLFDIGAVGSNAPLRGDVETDNPITASGRGRKRKK